MTAQTNVSLQILSLFHITPTTMLSGFHVTADFYFSMYITGNRFASCMCVCRFVCIHYFEFLSFDVFFIICVLFIINEFYSYQCQCVLEAAVTKTNSLYVQSYLAIKLILVVCLMSVFIPWFSESCSKLHSFPDIWSIHNSGLSHFRGYSGRAPLLL